MQIIDYTPITDSILLSSDIPEQTTVYPEWTSTYSFVTGQRCVITTPGYHKIYECIWHTPDCLNKYPPNYLTGTGALWKLISFTNRWKLFDQIVQPDRASIGDNVLGCDWETGRVWQPDTVWNTVTTSSAHISLLPGLIDTVALLNVDSNNVVIIMTDPSAGEVYNETETPTDTTNFNAVYGGLPAYPNAVLDIIVRNSIGDVNIGELIVGRARTLGTTKYGVDVGLVDFSAKTADGYGNFNITERAYSKRISCTFMTSTANHSGVFRLLEKYRATPLVWIVSGLYSTTLIYGYYRDFQMLIESLGLTECSLSIEGLGGGLINATPIPDVWVNPWDGIIHLIVPGVPTVGIPVLTKIEETPVAPDDPIALDVPAVPTVAASTVIYELIGTCTITTAEPGVVTCAGHGLAEDREVLFQNTEILTLDVAPGGAGWAVGDHIRGVTSGVTCRIAAAWSTTSYSIYLRSGTFTSGEVLTNETATADQGLGYPTITADNIPLPLTQLTHYFVMYDNVNQFRLSLTVAGSQIDTTTTMTGVAFLLAKQV